MKPLKLKDWGKETHRSQWFIYFSHATQVLGRTAYLQVNLETGEAKQFEAAPPIVSWLD